MDEYDDLFQPDEAELRMLESAFLGGSAAGNTRPQQNGGFDDEYADPMFDEAVEELEKMEHNGEGAYSQQQQQQQRGEDIEMSGAATSKVERQTSQEQRLFEDEKQELQRAVYAKAGEVTIVREKLKSASESHKAEVETLNTKHAGVLARANEEYAKLKSELEALKTDKAFRDFDRDRGNNSMAVVVNGLSSGVGIKQQQPPITPTKVKRRSDYATAYDFDTIDSRMSPSRGAKKAKKIEQPMAKPGKFNQISELSSKYIFEILESAKEIVHDECFAFFRDFISFSATDDPDDISAMTYLASVDRKGRKVPLDQVLLLDIVKPADAIKMISSTTLLMTTLCSLTSCWTECCQDQLTIAIPYLQNLILFSIPYFPLEIDVLLQQEWLGTLISLCETSIENHTGQRIKGLTLDADANGAPERALLSLNILRLLCEQGMGRDDNRKMCQRFRGDILLMACNSKQSPSIIEAALSLLLSTCGVSGFGPQNEDHAPGSCNPNIVLELVCRLLITPPSGIGRSTQAYLTLRLVVTTLLMRVISVCADGAFDIANTDVVVPRLSLCLADAVSLLAESESESILYDKQVMLIRMAMAVLYHVVITQCNSSLPDSLAYVQGARQAHIVAMTRLGLGSEHAELFPHEAVMARDLLEAAVSNKSCTKQS